MTGTPTPGATSAKVERQRRPLTVGAAAVEFDPGVLVIEFAPPGKLLNLNDRLHHQARGRLVRLWRDAAYWGACAAMPVGPTKRRLPDGRYSVQVILPVKGNLHRDPSNYVATAKCIVDGLSVDGRHGPGANLFPDDSAEFVTVPEPILVVGAELVRIEIRQV